MAFAFPFEDLPMRRQSDIEGGGSRLLFSHPLINGNNPLIIKTGANSVRWGYGLNTRRIPTYGGEVVQILSMYAESLKVRGYCRNYKEQEEIYDFFLKYIKIAGGMGAMGGNERNQTPITFAYPARGWTFDIFVTDLDDMKMALDVVAPEWGITAEIVSENDKYELGGALLTGMHQVLLDNALIKNKNTSGVIGYDPANKYSQDLLVTDSESFATQIDERLQSQIASWATGDFADYVFNRIVGDPDSSFQTAAQYWESVYGTDVAFIAGGDSYIDGSGPGLSGLSGVLDPDYVAAIAAEGAKLANRSELAKDPTWLEQAVRISYAEAGWDTQNTGYNTGDSKEASYDAFINKYANLVPAKGDNFDLGLWQINNYYHPEDILTAAGETVPDGDPDVHRKKMAELGSATKMYDPVANAHAAVLTYSKNSDTWNPWNSYPKSPNYDGNPGYNDSAQQAKAAVAKYLANPDFYKGAISGALSGTQVNKIKQVCQFLVSNSENIYYSRGDVRDDILSMSWADATARVRDRTRGIWGDCSSMAKAVYKWAGVSLPSGFGDATGSQVGACQKISNADAKPGDLVFFFEGDTSKHVEIILENLGGGRFKTFSHGGDGGDNDANTAGRRLDGAGATNVSPSFNEVPRQNSSRREEFYRIGAGVPD